MGRKLTFLLTLNYIFVSKFDGTIIWTRREINLRGNARISYNTNCIKINYYILLGVLFPRKNLFHKYILASSKKLITFALRDYYSFTMNKC